MFKGILGEAFEADERDAKNSIFKDFNLDFIFAMLDPTVRGCDVLPLYRHLPSTPEVTEYRREITRDMGKDEVRNPFIRYVKIIDKALKLERKATYASDVEQKHKWHVDALYLYSNELEHLYEELDRQEGLSHSMREFLDYLLQYRESPAYRNWREQVVWIHRVMDENRFTIRIWKNKVSAVEGCDQTGYFENICKILRVTREYDNRGRFGTGFDDDKLEPIEKAVVDMARKRYPKAFKQMKKLMDVSMDGKLLALAYDVQFYLSFYRFKKRMEEGGFYFSMPVKGDGLRIRNGYDIALAAKRLDEGEPVISNDVELRGKERFLVITGPNGGGKTTYARMVGQILYFAGIGLMAPCREAEVPWYSLLLSHFSVEESVESGKGKLMEELVRLRPMMLQDGENRFVILNELFTTAATKDAYRMGRRVMERFIATNSQGVYVTHIQSLAEENEHVVSMIARLCEDRKTRSFKIERRPAKEEEYEDSIIKKHHLTYRQIREVLHRGR